MINILRRGAAALLLLTVTVTMAPDARAQSGRSHELFPDPANGSTVTLHPGGSITLVLAPGHDHPPEELLTTLSGTGSGEFTVQKLPAAIAPGGRTTIVVNYLPKSESGSSVVLSVSSDDRRDRRFSLQLTGLPLSADRDKDGDGLSDLAEFRLAALGYDWNSDDGPKALLLKDNAAELGFVTHEQLEMKGAAALVLPGGDGSFKALLQLTASKDMTDFTPLLLVPKNLSTTSEGAVLLRHSSAEPDGFYQIEFR